MRILFGVTVPVTAYAFLTGQLKHLAAQGMDVHVAFSREGSTDPAEWAAGQNATYHQVSISRRPGSGDAASLRQLVGLMCSVRPDCAVLATPKMGMLGLLAARVTRVPRRIYLVHGLRYEGASGPARSVMETLERLVAGLATDVVAVSPSVAAGLGRIGVKAVVLGHGSANGIDVERFRPFNRAERRRARATMALPETGNVVLFVGRLTADKGLSYLVALARELRNEPDTTLLVVGSDETRTPAERADLAALRTEPVVQFREHRDDVETLYAAADLLVLPTKREGLPTVVLEAAACGVPCVATRATGVVDAIVREETGLIVERSDLSGLVSAVRQLLHDAPTLTRFGRHAREHVLDRYQQGDVWAGWGHYLGSRVETLAHAQ